MGRTPWLRPPGTSTNTSAPWTESTLPFLRAPSGCAPWPCLGDSASRSFSETPPSEAARQWEEQGHAPKASLRAFGVLALPAAAPFLWSPPALPATVNIRSPGERAMPNRQAAESLERNARREARTVLIVWALALLWSVGYCYLHGYQHAPDAWVVQIGLATPRTVAD